MTPMSKSRLLNALRNIGTEFLEDQQCVLAHEMQQIQDCKDHPSIICKQVREYQDTIRLTGNEIQNACRLLLSDSVTSASVRLLMLDLAESFYLQCFLSSILRLSDARKALKDTRFRPVKERSEPQPNAEAAIKEQADADFERTIGRAFDELFGSLSGRATSQTPNNTELPKLSGKTVIAKDSTVLKNDADLLQEMRALYDRPSTICPTCKLNTEGSTWCSAQKPGCPMPASPPSEALPDINPYSDLPANEPASLLGRPLCDMHGNRLTNGQMAAGGFPGDSAANAAEIDKALKLKPVHDFYAKHAMEAGISRDEAKRLLFARAYGFGRKNGKSRLQGELQSALSGALFIVRKSTGATYRLSGASKAVFNDRVQNVCTYHCKFAVEEIADDGTPVEIQPSIVLTVPQIFDAVRTAVQEGVVVGIPKDIKTAAPKLRFTCQVRDIHGISSRSAVHASSHDELMLLLAERKAETYEFTCQFSIDTPLPRS